MNTERTEQQKLHPIGSTLWYVGENGVTWSYVTGYQGTHFLVSRRRSNTVPPGNVVEQEMRAR